MKNFIEVTVGNDSTLVNVNAIVRVNRLETGCIIYLLPNDGSIRNQITVEQSYDEVKKLIEEAQ